MSEAVSQPVASGLSRRHAIEMHAVFLVLAIIVLSLAATMSVQSDGKQVNLPGMSSSLPELCQARRFAGIDCPGCGLTRSFISLGHGDLWSAAKYNLGGVILFSLVVAQIPYRVGQIWRLNAGRPEWRVMRLTTWIVGTLAIIMLLQWVWKMAHFGG